MAGNFLHLGATFTKASEDDDSITIEGYASTDSEDRAGDVVIPAAWEKGGLDNYKKNPILLFNHNYNDPIGKSTDIVVDGKGLKIKAVISKAAGKAYGLIKDGVLSTFSVGFRVKDAKYDSVNDLFIIKDAELFEISVVSVPCNQDAVFSVAKSFDSEDDYKEFVTKYKIVPAEPTVPVVKTTKSDKDKANGDKPDILEELEMTVEEIEAMIEKKATAKAKELEDARVKAVELETAKAAKVEKEKEAIKIEVTSQAETLMKDITAKFEKNEASLEETIKTLKQDIEANSAEMIKMNDSKRHFSNNNSNDSDWKKAHQEEIVDNFILGQATRKGWDTARAKSLLEKVNVSSGVEVSSASFEEIVSTTVERDIQNALILQPLFREIIMTSATQLLPILPDAGYAEFAAGLGTQTEPKGNLDSRDAAFGTNAGIDLVERQISTKKLISTSYLGNETEEDAILPILPLLRESMVRSHARSVEQAILVGNHADGVYGVGGASFNGLVQIADTDGSQGLIPGATFAVNALTAAALMGARKNMGKYGIRPEEVIYIVNQRGYFELLEDAEFQDMNLVGNMATKVKGSIGQVYGSNVIMCDEFAVPGINKFGAIAVNVRNFMVPRLRGMRLESEYSVKDQNQVLVATQRLGFIDLIDSATAVWGLAYAAA